MILEIPALFSVEGGQLAFRADDAECPSPDERCALAPSINLQWACRSDPQTGEGVTFEYDIDAVAWTTSKQRPFRELSGAEFEAARAFIIANHREDVENAAAGLARAMFGGWA